MTSALFDLMDLDGIGIQPELLPGCRLRRLELLGLAPSFTHKSLTKL